MSRQLLNSSHGFAGIPGNRRIGVALGLLQRRQARLSRGGRDSREARLAAHSNHAVPVVFDGVGQGLNYRLDLLIVANLSCESAEGTDDVVALHVVGALL